MLDNSDIDLYEIAQSAGFFWSGMILAIFNEQCILS